MIEVINSSNDPFFNLALEEYLLKNMPGAEEFFILWQDEPTVVVGKNQNTMAEINRDFIEDKGVNVVRRLSGGGAVYHDQGNLNFTFIVNENNTYSYDFKKFTLPIVDALKKMGIEAENNGRNDITIQGRKFSGNAQFRYKNRLLHHGTLLFDSNLEDMAAALNVSTEKISSKGIKSVRSRVTNISEHLSYPMDIATFRQILADSILRQEEKTKTYKLSVLDLEAIKNLREKKYSTWEWIYGASPAFNIEKKAQFSWGSINIRLDVRKGLIIACKIYGDFFSARDIGGLEQALKNMPYREEEIRGLLKGIEIARYIPGIREEEFSQLLFQ